MCNVGGSTYNRVDLHSCKYGTCGGWRKPNTTGSSHNFYKELSLQTSLPFYGIRFIILVRSVTRMSMDSTKHTRDSCSFASLMAGAAILFNVSYKSDSRPDCQTIPDFSLILHNYVSTILLMLQSVTSVNTKWQVLFWYMPYYISGQYTEGVHTQVFEIEATLTDLGP